MRRAPPRNVTAPGGPAAPRERHAVRPTFSRPPPWDAAPPWPGPTSPCRTPDRNDCRGRSSTPRRTSRPRRAPARKRPSPGGRPSAAATPRGGGRSLDERLDRRRQVENRGLDFVVFHGRERELLLHPHHLLHDQR